MVELLNCLIVEWLMAYRQRTSVIHSAIHQFTRSPIYLYDLWLARQKQAELKVERLLIPQT